jgi:hypothetical protein
MILLILMVMVAAFLPILADIAFVKLVPPSLQDINNPFDSFQKHAEGYYQLRFYGLRGKRVAQALLEEKLLGDELTPKHFDALGDNDLFTFEGTYAGSAMMFSYTYSSDMKRDAQWPIGTPRIIIAISDQIGAKEALAVFANITQFVRTKFRKKEWSIDPDRLYLLTRRRYRFMVFIFVGLELLIYFAATKCFHTLPGNSL